MKKKSECHCGVNSPVMGPFSLLFDKRGRGDMPWLDAVLLALGAVASLTLSSTPGGGIGAVSRAGGLAVHARSPARPALALHSLAAAGALHSAAILPMSAT